MLFCGLIITIIGLGVATTAGGAVYATQTFNEDVIINGDLGIKTSDPQSTLHVYSGTARDQLRVYGYGNGAAMYGSIWHGTGGLVSDCILYDREHIENGGEDRNVNDIIISTISAQIGAKYLDEFNRSNNEQLAYQKTLAFYDLKVLQAYEATLDLDYSNKEQGNIDASHNLAIRALHDVLPGEIEINGVPTVIFVIDPLGDRLNESEQHQHSSPLDGMFDEEFTGIEICITPTVCFSLDLLELDRSFGAQFATEADIDADSFDEFLLELSDGVFDSNDKVTQLIVESFARGQI